MAPAKTVLFLGSGNDDHGRFAELLFQAIALKFRLGWSALARGVIARPGGKDARTLAAVVVQALAQRGIKTVASYALPPVAATDLEQAERIIVLQAPAPVLPTAAAGIQAKLESWPLVDGAEALSQIEERINDLIARLLGGGTRPSAAAVATVPARQIPEKPPKALTVKVGRETAGRRGKGVTTVYDLPLDEEDLRQLATTLKQRCGTGGTVKDGRIEIQGDLRDRLCIELEKLGYKVKRVGG